VLQKPENRTSTAKIDTFPSSLLGTDPPGPAGPASILNTAPTDEIQALPKPINAVPASQFTFDLSSDPTAIAVPTAPASGHSASPHRLNRLIRKRVPNSPPPGPQRNDKAPRGQSQAQDHEYTAKSAILEARDLMVLASTLATSRDEQTRLLDLLEVFREYTEKGLLYKASSIISSQIANLETATRQIETKARDLNKTTITTSIPTNTVNTGK
jgi:hypothetical protein